MLLIDTNVLLDIFDRDPRWFSWSSQQLIDHASEEFSVNPLIFAELSCGFKTFEALETKLTALKVKRLSLPYEAAFHAGKAYLDYRKRGGIRNSPLPDFYIGAHALTAKLTILTRDPIRYRSYFPEVKLIAPDT
jgi:predicted nucleic acid-binding protein